MLVEELTDNARNPEIAGFVAVPGVHRHVDSHRAKGVEPEKHIGLEKIAPTDLFKRQASGDFRVDGRVPIGGIEQIPISGRQFRHQGKHCVAEQAKRIICPDEVVGTLG